MILICGVVDEPVTARLLAHAISRNIEYAFIDERNLFSKIQLDICLQDNHLSGDLIFDNWRLPVDSITGIFNRLWMSSSRVDELWRSTDKMYAFVRNIDFFLNSFPGKVANRPHALTSNGFKINQYSHIIQAGFNLPDTFTTNDVREAVELMGGNPAGWILKSNSGIRSKVRAVTAEDIALWKEHQAVPPVQFQKMLKGYNVRVHVVGEEVFACSIRTAEVDYRYGQEKEFQVVGLSAEMETQCIHLTRQLGLSLSGIDLFYAEDGRWYCFEVNCSPGYSWYEEHAGLPISNAICNYLS
jgi:hypothetical protein